MIDLRSWTLYENMKSWRNGLAICIGKIYSLNCILIFVKVDKHYEDKDGSFN